MKKSTPRARAHWRASEATWGPNPCTPQQEATAGCSPASLTAQRSRRAEDRSGCVHHPWASGSPLRHRATWGVPKPRAGDWMWEGLRMSWWDAWGSKLANPADNVVAAVVVLIGVVVTAAVTLLVSAANRRHERMREDRKQLFQLRAETYLQASKWLQNVFDPSSRDQSEESSSEELLDMIVRLNVYGLAKAAQLFFQAYMAAAAYRKQAHIKSDDSRLSQKEASKAITEFNNVIRRDIQGLPERVGWFAKRS